MWTNFSLQKKIKASLLAGLGVLIAVCLASYFSVTRMEDNTAQIIKAYRVIGASTSVLHSTIELERSARRRADGKPGATRELESAVRELPIRLRALRMTTAGNDSHEERLEQLQSLVADRISALRSAGATPMAPRGQTKITQRVRVVLVELQAVENRKLRRLEASTRSTRRSAHLMLGFGMALAVGITLSAGMIVLRELYRRQQTEAERNRFAEQLQQRVAEQTGELQRLEGHYRDVVENAVEGFFLSTLDGQFISANRALLHMYGYDSLAELMASITDISRQLYVNPTDRERFQRTLSDRGTVSGFEAQIRTRDGKILWVSESARLVRDEQGNPLRYEGTVEDITVRKQAELALEQSNRRITVLLQLETVLSEGRTIRDLAESGVKWLSKVLTGRSYCWLWDDERAQWRPLAASALAEEERARFFERKLHLPQLTVEQARNAGFPLVAIGPEGLDPDWGEMGIESAFMAPLVSEEKVLGLVAVAPRHVASLSEEAIELVQGAAARLGHVLSLRRSDEALRHQFARTQLLNRIAKALLIRVDVRGLVHAALSELEAEFGVAAASAILFEPDRRHVRVLRRGPQLLRQMTDLGFGEDVVIAIERTALGPCLQGESVYVPDLTQSSQELPRVLAKLGFGALVDVPLRVDGGILGALSVLRSEVNSFTNDEIKFLSTVGDHLALALQQGNLIDNLQRANEDLRQANERVAQQERLHALGTMASGIAHDFNNALSPILGFSELLLADPEKRADAAKLRNYLDMIHTSARDAASIVSRMREFSRPRDTTETFVPVDLNKLIDQAISLTRPKWKTQALARNAHIDIVRAFEKIPRVAGNESELREALTNLIFNAVDAMPEGGTITVRTSLANWDARMTEAEASDPNVEIRKCVVLSVEDTGAGMSADVVRHCLDPFFTTKGEQGSGLGLSMVHGILRRHAGSLEVQSKEGGGTTVTIHLPEYQREGAEKTVSPATSSLPSARVLAVDDEAMVRDVVREFLQFDGHEVMLASSGEEALQHFHTNRYDLVITDRAMPGMTGDQLAQVIKLTAPTKPVIMLTGFGQLMRQANELPAGVDVIVDKPVTLAALRGALAKALSKDTVAAEA